MASNFVYFAALAASEKPQPTIILYAGDGHGPGPSRAVSVVSYERAGIEVLEQLVNSVQLIVVHFFFSSCHRGYCALPSDQSLVKNIAPFRNTRPTFGVATLISQYPVREEVDERKAVLWMN